jgi:glycosyltransferase involved in cell wall biosynthesis
MSAPPSTISIVLATFNGEAFLEKQLASLANQTRSPLELVVSDDASSDATPEIIRDFQRRAPFPVIVQRNDHARGYRENFLSATQLARGRWISFCDQDGVWHPKKLEVCSTCMSIPGITQITHQVELIDRHGRDLGHFDQGIRRTGAKPQLAYDLWSTFWGLSMLVDRRVLQFVDFDRRFVDYIDSRHLVAHDRWAFFMAQTLGHTVEIAEKLATYRQHGNKRLGNQGPKARPGSVQEVRKENALHLTATLQMRDIVARLPVGIEKEFPLFDRDHALETCDRAVRQLLGRARIYDSQSTKAILECLGMMLRGDYRNAQDRSVRWRSFAKDLRISLKGA